jgi:uncharacterized membrane protein YidH (DUF202 family)
MLLRFSVGNLLILIAVMLILMAVSHFTNKEDSIRAMISSWRFAILVCNGFLVTLPALFMGLCVFNTTLKSGGIRFFGEQSKSR